MKFWKIGLVTAAMVGALSATARAGDCTRITAVGEMVTHDTAVLFSTNALKNLLAAKGLVGSGPVQTTCKDEATSVTCRSTQTACKGGTPKTCLGAWLCF